MFINKLLIFLIGVILGAFLGAIVYEFALLEIFPLSKTTENLQFMTLKFLNEKIQPNTTTKDKIFYNWVLCIKTITKKISEWIATNIKK
ncbi:hypothetical protein [Candidatus Phytoplasma sp. AldY-WA1]|uniref:hypothetical protein n=1 Tax=Candidatus Phytoplasma sp. AldY-WA1 TaxID=2852100 RepID=UPI0025507997|nr:hypothetical protein [Candidatus Phytoplasma sp. AldY-WA1]